MQHIKNTALPSPPTSPSQIISKKIKIRLAMRSHLLYTVLTQDGGRSSAVEPRIVVPVVVGSNPIVHPAGGLRKNLVIPPLFLFTPLTCLRYAWALLQ